MDWTKNSWQVDKIKAYRTLKPNSRFLCMFSGGKDSGLAFSIARTQGTPVALIHILEGENALYHEQPPKLVEAQAVCMGVPVIYMTYKWWHHWEEAQADLLNMHSTFADSIVFGDTQPKSIFLGDIPLSQRAGYKPCLPLGGIPYNQLMDQLEEHRIVSLITRINSPAIRPELLGTPFDRMIYQEFAELNIDPFGELDEFHTTLVDADCFCKPLRYHLVRRSDHFVEVVVEDDPIYFETE